MKRCDYCKTKLTVVRGTKRFCDSKCRVAFSRLSVPEQQIHSSTKVVRKNWCKEHDMDKQYCKFMKHKN